MKITDNVYLAGSGQIGLSHPFDCNIYLIDGENELALIDTGAGEDVDKVLFNIQKDGFDPGQIGKIILTHHHADHSGGCKKVRDAVCAKVYIHQEGAEYVEKGEQVRMGLEVAKRSGLYSPEYTFTPFKADFRIKDGETVPVGRLRLRASHTPGHSRDSTCFYMNTGSSALLFSGDVVLFEGKICLLNLPGSSLEDYRRSAPKISSLPCDALLPGHNLFVVEGGKQHVKKAYLALRKLVPPNLI